MPIIALVHTLDALAASDIGLSVNLKLLLDGEEELGSPTIGKLIDENRSLLDADLLLFCDGPMHQSRRTQLVFGVRGMTTVDITTYGATRPLHSGHYGNWAPNPIMQLSYLLTSMRDESGQILVDGYYDDVVPLSELERAAITAMPDITEALKDELSVHTPERPSDVLAPHPSHASDCARPDRDSDDGRKPSSARLRESIVRPNHHLAARKSR